MWDGIFIIKQSLDLRVRVHYPRVTKYTMRLVMETTKMYAVCLIEFVVDVIP